MKTLGIIFTYFFTIILGLSLGAFFLPQFFGSGELSGFSPVKNFEKIGIVHKDISYGTGELNTFNLYLPLEKGPNSNKLIVFLHAGGFTGGDKSDDKNILENFTQKGYVAAGINYSLRDAHNNASIALMTDEIKASIPKVVEESEKLGYKLDMMAIAGGSAGGNLAMTYAYRDGKDSPIPVKLVFQMVGPASFEPSAWYGFDENFESDESAVAAAGLISVFTGEPITPEMMRDGSYKEPLKNISPYALVDENSPPTLTAYGKLDKVAPYSASENYLFPALEKYNIPYENILFEKSGHALNRDSDKAKLLGEKIDEYLEKYLN